MSSGLSSDQRKDVSVVLCGQAGQGIQTVEHLLTRIFKLAGYNVFATKEYMSRVRGGVNSTQIRIGAGPVRAAVSRIDILIPLNKGALQRIEPRISPQTLVLADKEAIGDDFDQDRHRFVDVPLTRTATEIGNKIYSNVVAVGVVAGLFAISLNTAGDYLRRFFSSKSQDIVRENIQAIEKGFALGTALAESCKVRLDPAVDGAVEDQIVLSGAEAVGLGAIAGGCNFIASYPMSPSTGVLTFLARHAANLGIVVEQAEDEIAAMNMGLGAWYAGARAMVTTSGGGFALMIEGLSLAAMLESPMVIHLGQRPGPATGLPTRTEQADLEMALYSGHGEFPRILLAPGTMREAFDLTRKAFDLADRYQVPVFVLTDQYLMDSYYNDDAPDSSHIEEARHIVRTVKDYQRYAFTESGISPRGVPGFGEGLVVVDSDEHDTQGHITEDLDLRVRMVDKRLRKLESRKSDVVRSELVRGRDYRTLVVCWGSTYHIVTEALRVLGRSDTALLHFKQVYPLPDTTAAYLQKAEKTIIVENYATSQFGKLIRLCTGIEIENRILKYDGLSFCVDDLVEKLSVLVK